MSKIKPLELQLLSNLDGYGFIDGLWQKYIKPIKRRQQYSQYLLLALLLIGMFHPTSWNMEISVVFRRSSLYLLNILLFILLLLNGLGDRKAYRCALAIPLVLFVATFFSSLQDVHLGAYVAFLPMSLLFCVNLKGVSWSILLSGVWGVVNVTIIISSFAIVYDVLMFESFFMNLYSAFTHSLLPNMLYQNKPVSFFSSHSIASFVYFMFFFVNFKIFQHCRKNIYILFAIFYVIFLFFLRSSSSYYSLIIVLFVFVVYSFNILIQYKKNILITLFIVAGSLLLVNYYSNNLLYNDLMNFFCFVEKRLSSPGNGFLGRYSANGVLFGNVQYIKENPFFPVGFRSSSQFWFMDSGIIEYMLRGSVFLVFAIYYSLFRFLRFHLPSRSTYWLIFIIIFINELGFPYLKYFRFMFMFPFLVVYLRHLELDFPLKKAQG
ncbi:MAG: hypothetical protein U9R57_16700 [Thermodesulfobacteriota bacterium]|nr:hypothetical protein [Thermodesulfobacteriota bacterium]